MRVPSDESIEIAAAWLRSNEAGDEEQRACEAVADYLDHLLRESIIRMGARKAGVTPARFRRKLAEVRQAAHG